jgi:enamine deaminase RidA (YjgF/YER057c/UK114 family)
MARERQVIRTGPFKDFIADAVRVGDTIHVSGQVGVDAAGKVVGAGDLVAQVRQAYANVKDVLAGLDATMADIVDEIWFVTDMRDTMAKAREAFTVRAEAYGAMPQVTQTMVQVSALVLPELLVEIRCIAKV